MVCVSSGLHYTTLIGSEEIVSCTHNAQQVLGFNSKKRDLFASRIKVINLEEGQQRENLAQTTFETLFVFG